MPSIVTCVVTKKSEVTQPLELADIIFLTGALRQVEPCRSLHGTIEHDEGGAPQCTIGIAFHRSVTREDRGDILLRAVKRADIKHLNIREVTLVHAPLAFSVP